ncbi:MAG TPA: recombinase RecA [Candidatus Latescibacteria bacterium]|nr:recombinase RecA [Candidatus Handelsmanbacteria bacterium]HIL08856.1 recombinase RecA [Candidatus Latescibacterota bacterium]
MAKANGRGAEGDKAKALDLAMSQIEKQYGKGSIMRLGDEGGIQEVECISTGSLAVDAALGIGGLPKGRIIEIAGPEGAGKTMLALHTIREAQKKGGTAAFIDAEHALDVTFAKHIGVDVENLIISQPDSGEQALEIVDTLVRSGAFDIIVVDSVAALVPQAELEGDMGDSHMGLHARLMSQALRKLTSSIARSGTCLVFINQLRMKIGVVFGSPETTTGGRALPFYSSVRIDIRRIARVKDGDTDIGNRTRVKVIKNKVAPPFREAEFDLIFYGDDIGISWEGDLVDIGVDKGFVDKSGAWFSYKGERLGQGRDNAKKYLLEHPAIASEIEDSIRVELGLKAAPAGSAAGDKNKGAEAEE